MKFLIVLLVVLSCNEVIQARRQLYDGHDCPLVSKTKRHLIECNFCSCHQGNLVNCTHYICDKDDETLIATGEEMVCVEKEMKYDKCNLCKCVNNTWYCMEPNCDFTFTETDRGKRSVSESICMFDGMKKQEDCNECVCKKGEWQCSENSCAAKDGIMQYITFFEDDLKDVPCYPLDVLTIDCSICKCNNNSLGYVCEPSENCNEDQPLSEKVKSAKIYMHSILESDED